jgi:hypothetical protein
MSQKNTAHNLAQGKHLSDGEGRCDKATADNQPERTTYLP